MSGFMYCPECRKDWIEHYTEPFNGIYGPGGATRSYDIKHDGVKIEMRKIAPLGTDVGGFIWQCPKCKNIYSDWVELK